MHLHEENRCYFCQQRYDSRYHQLFECKEVQDDTHKAFKDKIGSEKNDLVEVIGSKRSEGKHISFIERVKFLKGQHEFVKEEQEIFRSYQRRRQNPLPAQRTKPAKP